MHVQEVLMPSKFISILLLFISFLFAFEAYGQENPDRGLEIYFVRHAQTEGNRTHIHSRENDRTFSEEGKEQLAALTEKLGQYNFDHILVSPKYRALNTIYPYLKKTGKRAEIWPELEECCWQKNRYGSPSSHLKRGKRIKLEAKMKPYFKFRNSDSRYKYKTRSYADGMAQMVMASDLIRKKFSQSGKKILIVGHYHAGARIIEMLQGLEPGGYIKLSNAKITHLKEIDGKKFSVISYNQ
jgi:broad specificity phosphatase PhoE